MWLMTTDGFLSAVQHSDEPDQVVVRGRVKNDVRDLARHLVAAERLDVDAETLIVSYPHADYPWRVIVSKVTWADYVHKQALAVDYFNFKTAVASLGLPGRHHANAYHEVWLDLLPLERTDPESVRSGSPLDFQSFEPDGES
jgi:hypothetical protein